MSLAIFKARLSHAHLKPRCERANFYEANVDRYAPRTFVVEHETGTLNSVRARVFDLAFGPLDIVIGQTATPIFCPAKTPYAFKHYNMGAFLPAAFTGDGHWDMMRRQLMKFNAARECSP